MGIPVPGETALITAALYAGSTHQIGIASVVLVAAMAAIIGDNIGYLIGRSIGIRSIVRYGRHVRLNEARLKMGQYSFRRHEERRPLREIRHISSKLRRSARRGKPDEMALFPNYERYRGNLLGLFVGGGAYLFGEEMRRVTRPVSLLLLVAAVGWITTGVIFFQRHEKEWEQRAEAAFPGPLR